jgi:hypothetical protein
MFSKLNKHQQNWASDLVHCGLNLFELRIKQYNWKKNSCFIGFLNFDAINFEILEISWAIMY